MALGGDLSSAYPMSRRQPCMRGRERPMARCGELGLTRPPGRRDAVHGGGAGFQVRLGGKGRPCPLWPQTAQLHSRLLRGAATRSPLGPARLRRPRRNPAHALRSPLPPRQDLGRAKESAPTLAHKRLHPHTLRHSTAVHLQKAGVDPPIRSWLSHGSLNTTSEYASVDFDMKREAPPAKPLGSPPRAPAAWWRLEAL